MTKLPADVARCLNRDRQCPSGSRCRRALVVPDNLDRVLYAAWESRIEPGADRCDGFIPVNPAEVS